MAVYAIPIHVPIYTDGARCLVISEWKRALELLRDSFGGAFDRFLLIAPARPAAGTDLLLAPIGAEDGFDPRPAIPADISRRGYWFGGRRRWHAALGAALDEADFAHTVVDNLYRPISFDAARLVARRGLPHAFFLDTDIVVQNRNLMAAGLMRKGPDQSLYLRAYERAVRARVAAADVAFLKGQALFDRYAGVAKNPKLFHDTSYQSSEVVTEAALAARSAARPAEALRLVYAGRLVARKGCDHAIRIVTKARELGINATLDLIGAGDERAALEALAGGDPAIRFLGERPYGPDLLQELSQYDGLLFTPLSEDTPRMIFDGYAAGLPLLAYDIPYVRERAAEEGAALLLPAGEIEASAAKLGQLARDDARLSALTEAAWKAGHDNATDRWYARRAAWTLEAFHAR